MVVLFHFHIYKKKYIYLYPRGRNTFLRPGVSRTLLVGVPTNISSKECLIHPRIENSAFWQEVQKCLVSHHQHHSPGCSVITARTWTPALTICLLCLLGRFYEFALPCAPAPRRAGDDPKARGMLQLVGYIWSAALQCIVLVRISRYRFE